MQKILRVATLLLALGSPAFAGEIHTPVGSPARISDIRTVTPPPTTSAVEEATANGEIHTPTAAEAILNVFLGLVPLF